jgi:hypothetical protein
MNKVLLTLLITLIVAGVGYFAYTNFVAKNNNIPAVPDQITEKLQIPFYFPTWLPGTFILDKDSVEMQEGMVMVYSATDEERNRLFFSQQVKPKDFDFNEFYNTKMIAAKKLENTPYEAYFGTSLYNNTKILSIVTNTTWILMTTQAPIDQVMAQKIAAEMKIEN